MTAGGRLILHVGLPKAASSALQFWCDGARDRLLADLLAQITPDPGEMATLHAGLRDWAARPV